MTQSPQPQTKANAFAALDKKVADGIAAAKAASLLQREMNGPNQPQPAAKS